MDDKQNPRFERSSWIVHIGNFLKNSILKIIGYPLLLLNLFFFIGIFDFRAQWLMGWFAHKCLRPAIGSIGIIILPLSLIVLSVALIMNRKQRLLNAVAQYSILLSFIALAIINLAIRIDRGRFFHPTDNDSVGVLGASLALAFKTLFGPIGGIVALALFALVFLPPVSGYTPGEITISGIRTFRTIGRKISSTIKRKRPIGLYDDESSSFQRSSTPIDALAPISQKTSRQKSKKDKTRGEKAGAFDYDNSSSPDSQLELNFHQMLRERGEYRFPPLDLLNPPGTVMADADKREIAELVEKTLTDYGVEAKVEGIIVGPVIIRCEIRPATGVRVSAIRSLKHELAMALAARSLRIEAPIPGRDVIGIEFPNSRKRIVTLREILESEEFRHSKSLLTVCIGQDLAGQAIIADLARMPHLLAAGQTGAGKSVCLNSIVISLLYNTAPDEVKIILIDPKRVEMNLYENLPHLLVPVVQEWEDAKNALLWVAKEMAARLLKLRETRCRDIATFNRKRPNGEFMPYIIIIVDEFATLMDLAPGHEVERLINHLARLARASGIHLILATQRPDVKVVTGSIKANIPARIAFKVPAQVDSRTILDRSGADLLLGEGDMLYSGPQDSSPRRAQGAFVSDDEIERVVNFVMNQLRPEYRPEILEHQGEVDDLHGIAPLEDYAKYDDDDDTGDDEKYIAEAIQIARRNKKRISGSLLQRELRIGYNKAARIIDLMEKKGLISGWDGQRSRRLLIDDDDDDDDITGLND